MLAGCQIAKGALGLALGLLWRLHVVLGIPDIETWRSLSLAAMDRFPFNAGTGFVVNGAGDVVSAAHVIGDCPLPAVVTPDGFAVGKVIAVSSEGDVAVMSTSLRPSTFASFPAYGDQGWRPVVVARFTSCAGPSSFSLLDAVAIDTLRRMPGILPILADQPIVGGNSGGPVIDAHGNIVGLVVARGLHFARYGIAADALVIARLLRGADRDVTLVGQGPPGSYVGAAALAADYTFPVVCLY